MEQIRCVVERITYTNQENGYTVLKVAAKNYNDLVTVVGIMPDELITVEGIGKIPTVWRMMSGESDLRLRT